MSPSRTDFEDSERPPPYRSASPVSAGSKASDGDNGSTANGLSPSQSRQDHRDVSRAPMSAEVAKSSLKTLSLPHEARDAISESKEKASALLLQMIPYRPNTLRISHNRLLAAGPETDIGPKPAMQEATTSARLLLDKWTTIGSAPISDVLDEETKREEM